MSTNSKRTSKVLNNDEMHQKTNKCEAKKPRLSGKIKSGNKGVLQINQTSLLKEQNKMKVYDAERQTKDGKPEVTNIYKTFQANKISKISDEEIAETRFEILRYNIVVYIV